ncbi:MAG: PD-(D/E)XK nuclease family protein, partial [Lachnospiraceae bacterium]|nr:PD-(D/E)XK nuclease family protein [Lachnospiraceae bacterium]
KDCDETVLVQGIIDGFFEENGELVLMDYKTDALPASREQILRNRYHVQMDFYKRALESITGKRVKETFLYSFSLGKEIIYG